MLFLKLSKLSKLSLREFHTFSFCCPPKKNACEAEATIELAAEKTTKRHRMSLCKAAETLDLAGSDLSVVAVAGD